MRLTRWDNGATIYEADVETMRELLVQAVAAGVDCFRARLDGACLDGACLVGARLVGASLVGASLVGARLVGASLVGARLDGASLVGARLVCASLDGASGLPPVATRDESNARLDQIREIVLADPDRLYMSSWHGEGWSAEKIPDVPGQCGTTHCLAGWAQALSTDPVVRRLDPQFAGKLLIPTANHMFYESNDRALRFLRDREYASSTR